MGINEKCYCRFFNIEFTSGKGYPAMLNDLSFYTSFAASLE
jgi:hypothetical protein